MYYSDRFPDYDSCLLPRPSSLSIDSDLPAASPDPLPVYYLCSVLFAVVIKLQMDPQASVSSQKTLPQSDPAALTQLTSELSAQANQLAIHQHQLTHLTALTEELVRSLQGLSLSPPAPAATQDDIPVNIPNHPPPPMSPRLAFPERFNGDSTMCKGFLLQCSLFVTQQPALYPNDASKIAICLLATHRKGSGLGYSRLARRWIGVPLLRFLPATLQGGV